MFVQTLSMRGLPGQSPQPGCLSARQFRRVHGRALFPPVLPMIKNACR